MVVGAYLSGEGIGGRQQAGPGPHCVPGPMMHPLHAGYRLSCWVCCELVGPGPLSALLSAAPHGVGFAVHWPSPVPHLFYSESHHAGPTLHLASGRHL